MNIEEIKKRLMKMKALANAGVGGERENAERLLAEIAAVSSESRRCQWASKKAS